MSIVVCLDNSIMLVWVLYKTYIRLIWVLYKRYKMRDVDIRDIVGMYKIISVMP